MQVSHCDSERGANYVVFFQRAERSMSQKWLLNKLNETLVIVLAKFREAEAKLLLTEPLSNDFEAFKATVCV